MKNIDVDSYDWESLSVGATARIHCSSPECDHKLDSLTITRIPEGCIFNCFRCSVRGKRTLYSSPSQAFNKLKHLGGYKTNTITHTDPNTKFVLPYDSMNLGYYDSQNIGYKVPSYIWSYLFKFNLTLQDCVNYNIQYSRKLDGIIFPIYDNNSKYSILIAYLIRYVNKTIKYKLVTKHTIYNYNNINNININNNRIIYKLFNMYNTYKHININNNINNINNNILILTEDIISCIKVYKCTQKCYSVYALLTTSVSDYSELKSYDHVILWLDYDAKAKALKTIMNMRGHGIKCSCIITPKDPKWYDCDAISKQIQYKYDAIKK